MPVGTFFRPSTSPYWMVVGSLETPRSLRIRPQKCVAIGTSVNSSKLVIAVERSGTETSFCWQLLSFWPS